MEEQLREAIGLLEKAVMLRTPADIDTWIASASEVCDALKAAVEPEEYSPSEFHKLGWWIQGLRDSSENPLEKILDLKTSIKMSAVQRKELLLQEREAKREYSFAMARAETVYDPGTKRFHKKMARISKEMDLNSLQDNLSDLERQELIYQRVIIVLERVYRIESK